MSRCQDGASPGSLMIKIKWLPLRSPRYFERDSAVIAQHLRLRVERCCEAGLPQAGALSRRGHGLSMEVHEITVSSVHPWEQIWFGNH